MFSSGKFRDAATMSDHALEAWKRRFTTRIVEVAKGEPELFSPGRRLGGGGVGIVHETRIDGIAVALKRTYTRRLTDQQWNEIKILEQISEQRHQHIVELIGSYVHRQRSGYELGLLIWPVAQTDLAAVLQDVDFLRNSVGSNEGNDGDDVDSAVNHLVSLIDLEPYHQETSGERSGMAMVVYLRTLGYLGRTFGCIANAISWLHRRGIRHKDIKPAQILLSATGLWLTDFGWSKDVSDLTNSATSGGDTITLKYHAPERAANKRCGTAEDIFAMGCVFLEIGTRLTRPDPHGGSMYHPWAEKMWCFHANLQDMQTWIAPFLEAGGGLPDLGRLIARMMARNPDNRPRVNEVVDVLCDEQEHFHGPCCAPRSKARVQEISDNLPSLASTREEPFRVETPVTDFHRRFPDQPSDLEVMDVDETERASMMAMMVQDWDPDKARHVGEADIESMMVEDWEPADSPSVLDYLDGSDEEDMLDAPLPPPPPPQAPQSQSLRSPSPLPPPSPPRSTTSKPTPFFKWAAQAPEPSPKPARQKSAEPVRQKPAVPALFRWAAGGSTKPRKTKKR